MIETVKLLMNTYSNNGRTIIFVKTKKEAAELSVLMESAVALHGDISQRERLENLNAFSAEFPDENANYSGGKTSRRKFAKTLIATDVAARGLDIPNVELVIQTEAPELEESYIHRSGRTGRMGKSGKCITLFNR